MKRILVLLTLLNFISCGSKLYPENSFSDNEYISPKNPVTGSSKLVLHKSNYEFETDIPVKLVSRGIWNYDKAKQEIILVTDQSFLQNFRAPGTSVDRARFDEFMYQV